MSGAKPKIVLLTMIKNEQANLRRLFESVRDWIDGYIVCDTGSTDGTVALANELVASLGKPGRVFEYPWVNFGVSRTKSFECFQAWVSEVGWDPAQTWALLLDADMVLSEEGGLHGKLAALSPSHSGGQIPQRNGALVYQNTRLLRASFPWKCIGATHEYWGSSGGMTQSWDAPVITDIGDGGCKADKYPRDARLLEEDLQKDPTNVRTHFYLGQTYMSMGRNEDAVRVLSRRIELGGWEEEVYIARLYKGDCLTHLGRVDEAVQEWLRAWQLRQHRTEAALRLIQHYRKIPNMAFIAMTFLEKLFQLQLGETLEGQRLWTPVQNRDILFVSHSDMRYPVYEELGILAFYTGRQEAARARLDREMLSAALNFHERNRLLELYRWYQWTLPTRRRVRLDLPSEVAVAAAPWMAEGIWRPFNPSIRREGDAYIVNLRHANYETVDAKVFTYRGHYNTIITRNLVAAFGSDFMVKPDVLTPYEVVVPPQYFANQSTNIHGIEDCRWLGSHSFLATSVQLVNHPMNKMVRVDLEEETKRVVRIKPLSAPTAKEDEDCQKNWLPFVHEGRELFVYKINPFTICAMNSQPILTWTPPKGFTLDGLRGSAAPIPWTSKTVPDEAYLMVVHGSHYGPGGRRYYHRFITLKADLTPSRIGRLMSLADENIQYCSGMCRNIDDNGVVLTFGINDSQAWAIEVEDAVVESALTPQYQQ
jgi:glycosyltransferase involved in cell wall biosynthesis